jgi:tRNA G18 (ribose-2'-O)-methylase SpoU
LYVILDRVRSAYNVGSIFRSCDSAGVDKLVLCGFTAVPPHPKLDKTALGSLESVDWEHHCSALSAVAYYKKLGFNIFVLETTPTAQDIFKTQISTDTCLVFGHEEDGVEPDIINLAHQVINIPHFGIKDSLNVAVAAGIAIYEFQRKRLYSH